MPSDLSDAFSYLEQRGRIYGIGLKDMLEKTPDSICSDPEKIIEFWKHKDISHVLPTSTHPELESDPGNWFPEDASENRSAHAETRDLQAIIEADIDNHLDIYDGDYNDDGMQDVID
jgi:hypothetical protein